MNRYLVGPTGSRLDRRGAASFRVFGALLLVIVATVAILVFGGSVDPAFIVVTLLLGLFGLIGSVGYAWVLLFRVSKRLDRAVKAWLAADTTTSFAEARGALPIAFRADFRTRAYHVLGLCAEANADFPEALELFRLSEASLPALAAPLRKNRALVLSRCHQALALAALGDRAGAHAAQQGALAAFVEAGRPGMVNALLGDAAWGLGAASLNQVIEGMEGGRDLRALLSMSGMRVALAAQAPREVLQIVAHEGPTLYRGILPRESLLVRRMEEAARAAIEPQYRSAALAVEADPAHQVWVKRMLGEPASAITLLGQ